MKLHLYYGLRSRGWGHLYWIDPQRLIEQLIRPGFRLHRVRYFTARVKHPKDKRDRQSAYLDALRAVSSAEVVFGSTTSRAPAAPVSTPGCPTRRR